MAPDLSGIYRGSGEGPAVLALAAAPHDGPEVVCQPLQTAGEQLTGTAARLQPAQPAATPSLHTVTMHCNLVGSQVWRVFSSSPVSRVEVAAAGAAYQPAGTSVLGPALPTPMLQTHLPTCEATIQSVKTAGSVLVLLFEASFKLLINRTGANVSVRKDVVKCLRYQSTAAPVLRSTLNSRLSTSVPSSPRSTVSSLRTSQ